MRKALVAVVAVLLSARIASAHVPDIADAGVPTEAPIADPVVRSVAVYGHLDADAVHTYAFVASADATIPLEVIVPNRNSLVGFRPSVALIGADAPSRGDYPYPLPEGMHALVLPAPADERATFYEEYGMESYFDGTEELVSLAAGKRYLIAVFEPHGVPGDYALAAGTAENFSGVNFAALLGTVAKAKLGAVAGRDIPWLDVLGTFLFVAGFVIGLGAVTVIDVHGFLGRTSPYWTEATVRAHKVTKPLIWIGTALATAGGIITYRGVGLSGTAFFHLILLVVLVLNGLFLTFVVSPYLLRQEKAGKPSELLPAPLQRKIAASFVVSFLGWWGAVFLFAWHAVMLR